MLAQALGAVFLLGICIFFHELGHFLIGKWVGVQPRIFSIGYGRALWFKKVGRTIYQITAIPLGGYVQFYNDDISRDPGKIKKGDFFSVGPWRRIALALGGPAFSIALGFIVIMTLVMLGWQPMRNTIHITDNASSAYAAGLREGDRIVAVNGERTESYEELLYAIGFASEPVLNLSVQRDGESLSIPVSPKPREPGSIRMLEGISPQGNKYLLSMTDITFDKGSIQKEDRILKADGKPLEKVSDLVEILNAGGKTSVELEIARRTGSFFAPEAEEFFTLIVPLKEREILILDSLRDVQTGVILNKREIFANQTDIISRISYKGENFADWNELKARLKNIENPVRLTVGAVEVEASVKLSSRKLIGISLAEGTEPAKATMSRDPLSIIIRSYDQTMFVTKGTLLGLYRLIEGKLSFDKSVSGPVKIVAIAAKSVTAGWETWWFLLAQITIVLGIMNLLPIPVLDGGHILFYLIEAVYKPLPVKVIAVTMRTGMALLLAMGVYVIGLDIWDVFVKGFL